ncbi:flagellar protein FliT [Paraburkholderia ultramafica]|nr:flagellar protein FliT [Paraburkholderia ultramafica]
MKGGIEMNSRELAASLLTLSLSIERAALEADWLEAARLGEERSPLLMLLTADADDETRDIARRIQAINESVLTMAAIGKDELQTEYRVAMSRTNATKEYHRIAML